MLRREYIREPSVAANWSLSPVVFSLVLCFVTTMAHRSGSLSSQNFVLVTGVVFVFSVLGFLLALLGLYAVWHHAAKGGKRSACALLLCLPILGTGLLALMLVAMTAPLSDISTDTLESPHFSIVFDTSNGENINEPPRIDGQIQVQFYPYLSGRRYALATDTIVAHVMKQIAENGWKPSYEKARSIGDGDWIMEATVITPVFNFADDIVVRITDEGNAAYVDMRSASRFGRVDLGGNARRIEKFMKDLDVRVSQQAQR